MTRILFVDDEPNVLSGIERSLHGMKDKWDLHFENDGKTALHTLSTLPFDVMVTDMRMPIMDGAELLQETREHFPQVVRIVLSGQSDVASAIRGVPLAHQFLSKPCTPDSLIHAIEKSTALHDRMFADDSLRATAYIDNLPSVPSTVLKLNELLEDESVNIKDIAAIVESDPGMTVRLLQLVNSAFFSLKSKIASPRDAIAILGIPTVRDLAASVEMFKMFNNDDPTAQQLIANLHQHSQLVSQLAQEMVDNKQDQMTALIGGLLHEIGLFALLNSNTDRLLELYEAHSAEQTVADIEQDILGVDHASFGARLLTMWGLPYRVVEVVGWHHDANQIESKENLAVHAVFTAEHLANAIGHGDAFWDSSTSELDDSYLESLGWHDKVSEIKSSDQTT